MAHLRKLIRGSELSAGQFARLVLARDERTLRRWLEGEQALPWSVCGWLQRVVEIRVAYDEELAADVVEIAVEYDPPATAARLLRSGGDGG